MSRTQLLLLLSALLCFFGLSGWLLYNGYQTSQHAFLTGAPPEAIQNALAPTTIDLAKMRPPAPQVTDPMRYGGTTSVASIIEFGDFECESCKLLHTVLQNVLPAYKGRIRLIWKDLPVTDINPHAMDAAIFARCAAQQGQFWEAYDALYEAQQLNEGTFTSIGRTLKLDQPALYACRRNPAIQSAIEHDVEIARHDGVSGAPFLFIGTTAHIGPISSEELKKAIDLFLAS